MRRSRLLALLAAACAVALAAPMPAAATDASGGAMAPADASVEPYTGGSVGPADDPAPTSPARVTPRVANPPTAAAAPSPPSTAAPAPVSHATGNAVEPPAGGDEPGATDDSPALEPLPPSSGRAQANATSGDTGHSLALTGGEMVTTLTLGFGLLAAGLAGTAIARRRRDAAGQYS
jgi:hypothetical protein